MRETELERGGKSEPPARGPYKDHFSLNFFHYSGDGVEFSVEVPSKLLIHISV